VFVPSTARVSYVCAMLAFIARALASSGVWQTKMCCT